MGLRINTNVASLAAQRNLQKTNRNLRGNFEKLASGERISKAGDDAAGLAISEKLKAHIRGIRQAKRNANDAVSLIQTSEGGLSEVSNIIIRLRELAMQSATDTLGDTERSFSDIEFQNLKDEIERIAQASEFNGAKLLNGTGKIFDFQIGIHNDPFVDRLNYDPIASAATLDALGLTTETIGDKMSAQQTLNTLDNALVQVNGLRANLGAIQNRLGSVVNNLGINDENLSAANSRIRDVDIASESADLVKNNILIQAGASVLSQANRVPSEVALKLIG